MSQTLKIYSWNVNGIRAVARNGFGEWLREAKPDIVCLHAGRSMPEGRTFSRRANVL